MRLTGNEMHCYPRQHGNCRVGRHPCSAYQECYHCNKNYCDYIIQDGDYQYADLCPDCNIKNPGWGTTPNREEVE